MQIKTSHLILRPIQADDAAQVHGYAGDPDITMMMFLPNDTFEETKEFVERSVAEWKKDSPEYYEFVIEHDGKIIGGCNVGVHDGNKMSAEFPKCIFGDIGWILHKDFRGRGFATEAAAALKEFAFTKLHLPEIYAQCDSENKASFRVMQNIGMELIDDKGKRVSKSGRSGIEYTCRIKNFYPPELESERLVLRPLSISDMNAVYKWTGDPEVARFMLYSRYKSEADGLLWLSGLYSRDKWLDYGFVLKETGELVGSGGLYFHRAGDVTYTEDMWGIGYNFRRDQWGKGLASEAMKCILDYGRRTYGIKTVAGTFALDNIGSRRVMEKLGMTYWKDSEYTKFDGSATFKAKTYRKDFL